MDDSNVITRKYIKCGFNNRIITKEYIIHNNEYIPIQVLWDTGSTNTYISNKLARELHLSPLPGIYTDVIETPYGKMDSNCYIIELKLGNLESKFEVYSHDYIDQGKIDLLIGMDIICQGDFYLTTNQNEVCFSFRCPSKGLIDFTKE